MYYQPGSNALRKATQTVEQLAAALEATLAWPADHADAEAETGEAGAIGRDPARQAQRELLAAMHRIRPITHVSSLARADASSLVFVEDEKTLAAALRSGAGAILIQKTLIQKSWDPASGAPHPAWHLTDPDPSAEPRPGGPALLLVAQPRVAFARAARLLRPSESPTGVHATAQIAYGTAYGLRVSIGANTVIDKGVAIGNDTRIGAGVVIGAGVSIGLGCRIDPRVVIYPGVAIGDRVVVQAGAVLGSDGFGYVRDDATGAYIPFPQQGTLVIEDDVEIGANTTIDRGALEETRIGRGTKIDNLVHVGHNVQIGTNAILAAQVGISGSSTIGAGAVLAGQVGIGDHAAVGEGVVLGGQGGVLPHKSLQGKGQLFWGTPAKPARQYLRELATLTRLARRGRSGSAADSGPDSGKD